MLLECLSNFHETWHAYNATYIYFTSPRYMDMKLVTTKTHKNRKTKLQYNKNA
jgi:hypothetical protein